MLGKPKKPEPKLFYHGISLERRIPKEHPLRKIKQLVNFNFIRSQVVDTYGVNGNQSVDPAVILKLMFLLFYENIKSERALMRQMPLRMDWLWFCDYDLDEATPDHSVLSKARRRWGAEIFEQFFMNILQQCITAGLVDGETIYIDSSTIDANADIDKVQPQLRRAAINLTDKLEDISEPQQGNQKKPEKRVNPSDPDARIGRKYGKSTLGFKDHRVVDDKHNIITSTITTPANINDDKVLTEAVNSHQFKTRTKAKIVTADKGYGTAANYKYLRENNITPCILHNLHRSPDDRNFANDKFVCDSINDCYICPSGEKLSRISTNTKTGVKCYAADRQTCQKCNYFSKCVSGQKSGRSIYRNPDAEYWQWADRCLTKYQRKILLARRKYKSEGSFADAANNHGFKRARWRGLTKMKIQNFMISAIQNLRKLLRYGDINKKSSAPAAALKSFFEEVNCACWRILSTVQLAMSEY